MAGENDEKPDYLPMSDEDFMKINSPASSTASEETQEPTPIVEADKTVVDADDNKDADKSTENPPEKQDDSADKGKVDDAGNPIPDADAGAKADDPSGAKPDDAKPADKDKDKASADPKDPTKTADPANPADTDKSADAEPKPVDHKAFFELVMKPFKANGREIKINTPDEAIRLMQMGAGYGKKLQALQPALKSLRLLEKHNLLDDNKLSFLIDLDQKNPEAIKKLIKESGIDVLDLNTDAAVTYTAPNRAVSDQEVAFSDALKTLESHPQGKATITEINGWDAKSKQALYAQPELLTVIQDQKDTGTYSIIVAEIDRQKALGIIPHSKPFLEAYTIAGDYLVAQGGLGRGTADLKPSTTEQQTQPVQKVPIESRVATPAPTVSNGDKAQAAAATKASTKKASTAVNPLALADDVFMKQFEGRL
jgi:hypothetical protein